MEKKKKLWWRKRQLWIVGFTLMGILVFLENLWEPQMVQAGVYDNAYTFYQTYGSEMAFMAGPENKGEIYYATKGKKNSSSGIRYSTIGWKVRVFHGSGALVDTIYYKLGGSYMTSVDVQTVDGYEYCLYRVTLENLKNRLSGSGREALNSPECNIVFDACISVKRNGTLEGEMTDNGPSWGDVYTTYNGIVNAQDWASDTRESLKSYYNKTVDGLFHEVKVEKGSGIQTVSGGGRYCFGTTVTIQAECEEGYHFSGWTGSAVSAEKAYSFVMNAGDVTFTANAKENSYRILFDTAGGLGSVPEHFRNYNEVFTLPTSEIYMDNATLSAWKIQTTEGELIFTIGKEVSVKEIVQRLALQDEDGATIIFYASWDGGPLIYPEVIYVSLIDAVEGKITEDWLAKKAFACDQEDGEIPYGRNENTSFFIENYNASDFTEFQDEGSVVETFFAIDSAGNVTRKDILVYVTDIQSCSKVRMTGRVRFISEKYFWDEEGNLLSEEMGGLETASIWRVDETYRMFLEEFFKRIKESVEK